MEAKDERLKVRLRKAALSGTEPETKRWFVHDGVIKSHTVAPTFSSVKTHGRL
jgi:hypothetical protein